MQPSAVRAPPLPSADRGMPECSDRQEWQMQRLDFDLLARARLVFIETIEEFPTGLSEAKRVPEPHPAGQEFALALIRANFGSISLLASL
jgi:hypothetical protein